jgi:hypothetical protein
VTQPTIFFGAKLLIVHVFHSKFKANDSPWMDPVKGVILERVGTNGNKQKVKVKVTLEQAMKAQRGCRGIAVLFL